MFPRLTRAEFWQRFIVFFVVFMVIVKCLSPEGFGAFAMIFDIIFFLHACTRRCHDCNYSGFCMLWLLVPIVQLVFLIMLLAKNGTIGPNAYGPDPLRRYAAPTDTKQSGQQVDIAAKKGQLRRLLQANHPYHDMLIRNKV